MTWLPGASERAALADVLELRPGLRPRVAEMLGQLWQEGSVPARVLELCRLRVAQLLGCDPELRTRTPVAVADCDEATIAELTRWPTSSRFDHVDRACLSYAEQFVIDVHGIADADVERVREVLGDAGAVALTVGLALFEGFARAQQVLGVTAPDDGRTWHD